MESPRQSTKRNLDWSPTNLREPPSKKSRPPSSPRVLSYSSSFDSDESTAGATTSKTDTSSNTVYDTSNLQDNVEPQKADKSKSTEKQGDEGDNDDEAMDWEEYHQQSRSSFTSTDEYDEPEQLFDGKDSNSYKIFCKERVFCPFIPQLIEDPSSPFTGEDDEVDQKFQSFLSEYPDEEHGVVYLRLRQDAHEVISLSKEDIQELENSKPFKATQEHVNSYLYWRLNLFPNEVQQRINRCSAYRMKDLEEEEIDIEMKEVDFNIIPLIYREHWTLAIVCGLGPRRDADLPGVPWRLPCVLHFNSLKHAGIKEHHGYAIAKAVAKKAHIDEENVKWHQIRSPQQSNSTDCGFYVMRFAVDFVKNICSPDSLPVHVLFHLLQSSARYEEYGEEWEITEEYREITKVAKKARQQLKGSIGLIRPEERDWMFF